ncbi:MAG: hypothetical protein ACP5UL_01105 [Thermoplasmata archaeon]
MAKRGIKKEEEEKISLPEFNEVEFINKELQETKIFFISLGLAVAGGILAFLGTRYLSMQLALLLGFGLPFLIFFIFYMIIKERMNLSHYKPFNWISHFGVIFITVIMVWLLLINAPFSYMSSPYITQVNIYYSISHNNTWQKASLQLINGNLVMASGKSIPQNSEVNISFIIDSSTTIKNVNLNITGPVSFNYTLNPNVSIYSAKWNVTRSGIYTITIIAYDINEHSTSTKVSINVG